MDLGTNIPLVSTTSNERIMKKSALTLFMVLFSIAIYSQKNLGTPEHANIPNQTPLITLQMLVDKIKSEDKSLRNVEAVNVMVNNLLIKNLEQYMINPDKIAQQEVLVLNANGANRDSMRASIIINTTNK